VRELKATIVGTRYSSYTDKTTGELKEYKDLYISYPPKGDTSKKETRGMIVERLAADFDVRQVEIGSVVDLDVEVRGKFKVAVEYEVIKKAG
jgi:hypothetical protein